MSFSNSFSMFMIVASVLQVRNVGPFVLCDEEFKSTSLASNSNSHSEIMRCGTGSRRKRFKTSIPGGKSNWGSCKYWQYAQMTLRASSRHNKETLFRNGLYLSKTSICGHVHVTFGRVCESLAVDPIVSIAEVFSHDLEMRHSSKRQLPESRH